MENYSCSPRANYQEPYIEKYPDGKIMNDLPIEESFQIYKEAGLVS